MTETKKVSYICSNVQTHHVLADAEVKLFLVIHFKQVLVRICIYMVLFY